jgi:hypothetical protein
MSLSKRAYHLAFVAKAKTVARHRNYLSVPRRYAKNLTETVDLLNNYLLRAHPR